MIIYMPVSECVRLVYFSFISLGMFSMLIISVDTNSITDAFNLSGNKRKIHTDTRTHMNSGNVPKALCIRNSYKFYS